MAFLSVEDMDGSIEVIVFPQTFSEYEEHITEGAVLFVEGRLSIREDEAAKIVISSIHTLDEIKSKPINSTQYNKRKEKTVAETKEKNRLFIRVPSKDSDEHKKVMTLFSIFPGKTKAYFFYTDTDTYEKLPFGVDFNAPVQKELLYILKDENNIVLQ